MASVYIYIYIYIVFEAQKLWKSKGTLFYYKVSGIISRFTPDRYSTRIMATIVSIPVLYVLRYSECLKRVFLNIYVFPFVNKYDRACTYNDGYMIIICKPMISIQHGILFSHYEHYSFIWYVSLLIYNTPTHRMYNSYVLLSMKHNLNGPFATKFMHSIHLSLF